MREKIYNILNKIYGVLMTVSFFGGILPLFAYIIAMIIGGKTGENLAVFMSEKFYPYYYSAQRSFVKGKRTRYAVKSRDSGEKSKGYRFP